MGHRTHVLLPKEVLEDLYLTQKMSLGQIALRENVPYSLVRASFHRCGLRWRTKSEARRLRPFLDSETKAKIAVGRTGCKDTPEVVAKKRRILASAGGWGWNKGLKAGTDVRVARQTAAMQSAMRTPAFRDAASKIKASQIAAGNYYARGYYNSPKVGRVYYMSGWELRRWQEFDKDPEIVAYKVHPCIIPYFWEGAKKRYIPDVLVQYVGGRTVLEEIKPKRIVEDAVEKNNRVAVKLNAGKKWAEEHGWGWRVVSATGRRGEGPFTSN